MDRRVGWAVIGIPIDEDEEVRAAEGPGGPAGRAARLEPPHEEAAGGERPPHNT